MTALTINILPVYKPVVSVGDEVEKGTILAKISEDKSPHLALHNILNVKAEAIGKYLVKKEGDEVGKHEVIAKKKGLLSTTQVKSPVDGRLYIIDSLPGYVGIVGEEEVEIASPVAGVVSSVTDKQVIIETDKEVVAGIGGEGEAEGELYEIESSRKIFEIGKEVEGKIVYGEGIDAAEVAKIKALGGVGVVLEKEIKGAGLPFIIIREIGVIREIGGIRGKIVNRGGHYLISNQ